MSAHHQIHSRADTCMENALASLPAVSKPDSSGDSILTRFLHSSAWTLPLTCLFVLYLSRDKGLHSFLLIPPPPTDGGGGDEGHYT